MEGNILLQAGNDLSQPATHLSLSLVTGKAVNAEIAEITSRIGEFQPLRVYIALQAISGEAAQELAGFLTNRWESIRQQYVSLYAEPRIRPDLAPHS